LPNKVIHSKEDYELRKIVVSNAFKLHKLRGLEENIRRSTSNTAATSKQVID
jgi:hypothetical protein